MTRAEVEGARVWHSPSTGRWWMDPRDPLAARALIAAHEDAINVTNAYDTFSHEAIVRLMKDAGR